MARIVVNERASRARTEQLLTELEHSDEEYIIDALRAGTCGHLLKDIPAHDLARAVQAAHRGIYQLDPTIALKVVASLSKTPSPPVPHAPPSQFCCYLLLFAVGTGIHTLDRLTPSFNHS